MTQGIPSPPPPQRPVSPAGGADSAGPSKGPLVLVVGAVTVLIAGTIGVFALLVANADESPELVASESSTTSSAPTTTQAETTTTTESSTTSIAAVVDENDEIDEVSLTELSRAVVQLVPFDIDGRPLWNGSGTVIESDGLILTNAHVVEQDPTSPYDWLGVYFSPDPAMPPELLYRAVVVAFEPELDLAVVSIVADADGNEVEVADLPTIPVGDSDTVDLGDDLRILGFPGIGGETITLTRGSVAGFNTQAGIGNRAWIKTDATITGGNSGGAAINESGELIGVPTIAGAGDVEEVTDCRRIQDTNGDNVIDDEDNCTPIGGFINGLRPVNLAADAIGVARLRQAVDAEIEDTDALDVDDIAFSAITFSSGQVDDAPVDEVDLLPAGGEQVCAFWDYEGMVDGLIWDALWSVDGQQADVASILGETWVGGESGNWWVCFLAGEQGLLPGVYDLVIWVEGESLVSGNVVVGDRGRTDVVVDNQSDRVICFLRLSPTVSQSWGEDDLGAQQVIDVGTSASISLPTEVYDLQALDCDVEIIEEIYEVDVTVTPNFVVEG